MSRCLCDRSIDHVVFERGEIAHTWRTERWDSLRLLTPNWQSRLPAFHYDGNDPDGYRTVTEVIEFIASYAKAISAPVLTNTTVTSVRSTEAGYLVRRTKTIGYAGRSSSRLEHATSLTFPALPIRCRGRSRN